MELWQFRKIPITWSLKEDWTGVSQNVPDLQAAAGLSQAVGCGVHMRMIVSSGGICRLTLFLFLVGAGDNCPRFQHFQTVGKMAVLSPFQMQP